MTAFFCLKVAGTTALETPEIENKGVRDQSTEKNLIFGWRLTEGLGEESDTLGGDSVVVPLPVENLGEVALGDERLDDHHDLQVGNVANVLVAGQVTVFADDDDSLLQQVGENSSLFGFAHKYHDSSFSRVMIYIQ